jgi:hypothetical protein
MINRQAFVLFEDNNEFSNENFHFYWRWFNQKDTLILVPFTQCLLGDSLKL